MDDEQPKTIEFAVLAAIFLISLGATFFLAWIGIIPEWIWKAHVAF